MVKLSWFVQHMSGSDVNGIIDLTKAQTPPLCWIDRSFRIKLYPGIFMELSRIFGFSHVSVISVKSTPF